jgi:hypothetical protein
MSLERGSSWRVKVPKADAQLRTHSTSAGEYRAKPGLAAIVHTSEQPPGRPRLLKQLPDCQLAPGVNEQNVANAQSHQQLKYVPGPITENLRKITVQYRRDYDESIFCEDALWDLFHRCAFAMFSASSGGERQRPPNFLTSSSGEWSMTFPRPFTSTPLRCHSLSKRLTANIVTFAWLASSSLVTLSSILSATFCPIPLANLLSTRATL